MTTICSRIQWLRNHIHNYHLQKEKEKESKEKEEIIKPIIGSFFFSPESCLYREFLEELKNDPKYIAYAKVTTNIHIKKPQFVFDNYFYHPSITVSKKTFKKAIQLCDDLYNLYNSTFIKS